MKTTTKTAYTGSPVIQIKNKSGSKVMICISETGNIYRSIFKHEKTDETLTECEMIDVFLNEKTKELIKEFENSFNFFNSKLGKKIDIQQWYILGVCYTRYRISENPLCDIDECKYYDVLNASRLKENVEILLNKLSSKNKDLAILSRIILENPKLRNITIDGKIREFKRKYL